MKVRTAIFTLPILLFACTSDEPSTTTGVECKAGSEASPGIVGCWELDAVIGSEEGLLVVSSTAGESEARLYFFLGESLYFAEFDVFEEYVEDDGSDGTDTDTGETGDSGQGTVKLRFECRPVLTEDDAPPCAELDFSLECNYEASTMSCSLMSGSWVQYPFSWTRCSPGSCPTSD